MRLGSGFCTWQGKRLACAIAAVSGFATGFTAAAAAAAGASAFDAAKMCASGPSLATLVKDVFPYTEARSAVAALVASGRPEGAGCARAIDEGLAEIASGKPGDRVKENKIGLLLVGAESKRDGLAKALEVTIATEQQKTELFGALLDANRTEGRRALRLWFAQTAEGLRSTQKLGVLDPGLYGKATSAPGSLGLDDVKLTYPLIFSRYITELEAAGFEGGEKELASFALVYAMQDAGSRRIQADAVARVVAKNEALFLSAFRAEHPLVQFRLVPLMAKARTPRLVRELLWISSNHGDVRVKSLASGVLDAAMETTRPAR